MDCRFKREKVKWIIRYLGDRKIYYSDFVVDNVFLNSK